MFLTDRVVGFTGMIDGEMEYRKVFFCKLKTNIKIVDKKNQVFIK